MAKLKEFEPRLKYEKQSNILEKRYRLDTMYRPDRLQYFGLIGYNISD